VPAYPDLPLASEGASTDAIIREENLNSKPITAPKTIMPVAPALPR